MQVLRASSAHSDDLCLKRPATRRDTTGRRGTALLSSPERSATAEPVQNIDLVR
jgi:hypothetical protein